MSSSSASIWFTGSIRTLWFGIQEGTTSLSRILMLLVFSSFLMLLSFLLSSKFSISVSPQMDMLDNMLCFLSPVFCEGLYLFVFLTGFMISCCLVRGTRTVKLDRRLERLDSSSLSKSSFQKPPFPGSSFERATFTKHLFRDRLWRIEFWN